MATITVNRMDFEKLLGKRLATEELGNKISMLGTSVEKIDSDMVEVEIFPNRPDLLSTEGLARALSFFIGAKKPGKYTVRNSEYKATTDNSVKKIRPYAVAAIVKNIRLTNDAIESIMQLQEKLHITIGRNRKKASIGVYDLDKIKFPLVYTTKPKNFRFTPLESKEKLTLSQILAKNPKGKEYAHLIESFDEFPIWIDADNKVLSMPPIINSEDTKVDSRTRNLFIDVTGLDLRTVEQALNIVVTALAERGAEIYSVKINNKTYPNLNPDKIKLDISYANKILGLKLNKNDLKKYLERMGYEAGKDILVPAYRTDVINQIDLVEDIAIAYGYENFKEEIPNVATIAEEDRFEIFKRKIAKLAIGLGLMEVNTYHLTNENDAVKKMNYNIEFVRLENAINEDYNILRRWLIPSLIKILESNKHNEYPQNIFEIGTIFKENLEEASRLAVILCSNEANFTATKQIMDAIFSALNLDYKIEEIKHGSFIDGRAGRVFVNGKKVAYIGEINPAVLDNFGLEIPVAALELNLDELFKISKH